MHFTNSQIDIQNLPRADEVVLQPVSPLYLRVLRIEWSITAVILGLITAACLFFLPGLRSSPGWQILCGSYLLIMLFYLVSMERSFPFLAFAVREKDVFSRKGWIIRKLRISHFNRTQNCTVQSGPLERRFGLATLVIYTAGSEGADMRIHGLPAAEADRLRQFILHKIGTETNDGV